jgi:protoporphyrinogen oxidase
MTAKKKIGIVGGGMLGLVLAHRLSQRGHEVTVIEASPRPGGLAGPWSVGGVTWDRFYHVILMSDLRLRGLLEELGIADALTWGTTRTGFYTDGRLYSMSDTVEFLRFPPLDLLGKLRLGGTIFYASKVQDWRRLEGITVEDWLRRWSGDATFERMWLPLLRAKLGDNYKLANAAFIWATIARMYAARRSGLKTERFGYVRGGYAHILQALEARLAQSGVRTLCGTPVARVFNGPPARVEFEDGREETFDAVVLTLPALRVPDLCPEMGPGEASRLRAVTYQGIVCASVLLSRPLGGFYVTNITEPDVPFTAVIEMSALVDRAELGGHHLVYLPRYLTHDAEFWSKSDAEVRTLFLAGLRRMYPDLRDEEILAFEVARARDVMALPTLHYSTALMPRCETSLPNLFLMGSAQIADGTLNVNETIGLCDRHLPTLEAALERG